MKTSTAWTKIVWTTGCLATLLAACAAPTGPERPEEPSGSTSEALPPGGDDDGDPFVTCGTAGALGGDTFEDLLADLGCAGKSVYATSSSTIGFFETLCPTNTVTRNAFQCGAQGWVRGGIAKVVSCYANVKPIYAEEYSDSECGRHRTVSSAHVFVSWDPNCPKPSCTNPVAW
jgi:hypothetical protein